jgi:hypothetical protein|nr:MAG TPA: hypothetical protein [Caudoviricetes sp.]
MKELFSDPFVTTVILGTLWPLVQAALDRPWWTRGRRVALVVGAAVVLTVGAWALSAYPLQVELLAGQVGKFLGFAWAGYQVLSRIKIGGVSVLNWAGIVTPGGETRDHYTPRHEAP